MVDHFGTFEIFFKNFNRILNFPKLCITMVDLKFFFKNFIMQTSSRPMFGHIGAFEKNFKNFIACLASARTAS